MNSFERKGKLISKSPLRESQKGVKYLNFVISVSKQISYMQDGQRRMKWDNVLHKFVVFRDLAEIVNDISDGTILLVKGSQEPIRTYDIIPGNDNEKKKNMINLLKEKKKIDLWLIDGTFKSNVKEIYIEPQKKKEPEKDEPASEPESNDDFLSDIDDDDLSL